MGLDAEEIVDFCKEMTGFGVTTGDAFRTKRMGRGTLSERSTSPKRPLPKERSSSKSALGRMYFSIVDIGDMEVGWL
jgi:hypothetical protein